MNVIRIGASPALFPVSDDTARAGVMLEYEIPRPDGTGTETYGVPLKISQAVELLGRLWLVLSGPPFPMPAGADGEGPDG